MVSPMKNPAFSPELSVLIVLLTLTFTTSGCLLLGAGAAAVGGCAVLDENQDDRVTEAEASAALFERWDTNDNESLTEAEFNAGTERGEAFEDWADDFDDWDTDESDSLNESEFVTGASEGPDDWLDERCDDLGL